MRKPRAVVVSAVLLIVLGVVGWRFRPHDRDTANARVVIDDMLTAPSTAEYLSIKILERKNDYRLARVVVDSKNGFGAVVRGKFCLVWHTENGLVKWRPAAIKSDCAEVLTLQEWHDIKEAGGWPE